MECHLSFTLGCTQHTRSEKRDRAKDALLRRGNPCWKSRRWSVQL